MVIGALAGLACAAAVSAKLWLGVDDALDVVGVHLVGGVLGTVCVGLFATTAVNAGGANGLFSGGGYGLLWRQAAAALAVAGYSFAVTWVIGRVLERFVGNRVTPAQEEEGLDLALHGESGYEFGTAGGDVRI
jgi:Amt family ammonium transporter